MLATLAKAPFNSKEWVYEVKWDGYRVMAHIKKGSVKLLTRSAQNYTANFPSIGKEFSAFGHEAIIDGELVVLDEAGKPNFDELQRYNGRLPAQFYAFDIVWLDGRLLTSLPLLERKKILVKVLPVSGTIKYSDHFEDGMALFDQMKQLGLEGIVAKKRNSTYRPGIRSNDWLKIQTAKRQEFVVGGWTESTSGRTFRSLIFGWYVDGDLHYVGHAGHGFKESEMPGILANLKKLETKKNPFVNTVEAETTVHWIKPELVIEVKFATFTRIGRIRKPAIFMGFRQDKRPKEISSNQDLVPSQQTEKLRRMSTMEDSNWPIIEKAKVTSEDKINIEGSAVRITNVEKKLWKDVTKADLIRYYDSVSDFILPHLHDRPLSLHVKPVAPTVKGFYIKDMEGRQPEYAQIFSTERKHKKKGKREVIEYLVCNNLPTLLYIINLGCIDLNPSTSRTSNYYQPDFVIIDLDPSDDDFKKAIDTALAAKQVFDKYKLKVCPKTSGKSGIHLYIPCAGFTFSQARNIAENICTMIHDLVPSITSTEVEINRRGSKLYLDPNQNDEADTVAAPYSVRPYRIPTVSAPLTWREINANLDPADFTIHNMGERVAKKGDLFEDALDKKIAQKNSRILTAFV